VAYGDPVAGLYATAAALVALHARPRLGGADIELCQVECLFQLGADALIGEQVLGAPLPRTGSRRASASPCCAAPCLGNDAWVAVCVDDDAAWRGLCQVIGASEWADDPALATIAGRVDRADEIEERIGAWSSGHTSAQAAALLQAAGVAAAPVAPHRDLHADPHLLAAGYWQVQERRYIGRHIQPATAFRLDGRRPRIRLLPPVLGEHTEEALAEVMAGA
jgi:crotonobetainyl-CoA:carnitine CoA-transferase CaiB-like acyl-CoA transferase